MSLRLIISMGFSSKYAGCSQRGGCGGGILPPCGIRDAAVIRLGHTLNKGSKMMFRGVRLDREGDLPA
ncbi:MAG TPA: hypothetical protein DCZ91_15100, partial [Lachnospiraceae bacterium]|nr:hypothetical protein [Lachnospiraceae bacterium]